MKHISKTALLFGALSMLVSTVPVQAMGDIGPEVAQKQGFFAKWTQKAKSLRLDALRKELDRHWKKFMACVKSDKGCPKSLVWTIRGILATIIALVAVGAPVVVTTQVGPTKGWVGRARAGAKHGMLGEPRAARWVATGYQPKLSEQEIDTILVSFGINKIKYKGLLQQVGNRELTVDEVKDRLASIRREDFLSVQNGLVEIYNQLGEGILAKAIAREKP